MGSQRLKTCLEYKSKHIGQNQSLQVFGLTHLGSRIYKLSSDLEA